MLKKTVSLRDLAPAGDIKSTSDRDSSHGDSREECDIPSTSLTAKTPVLCIKKSAMGNDIHSEAKSEKQSGECPMDTCVEQDKALQVEKTITRYGRESKPVNRYGI